MRSRIIHRRPILLIIVDNVAMILAEPVVASTHLPQESPRRSGNHWHIVLDLRDVVPEDVG